VSDRDLASMRRIDELHLAYPFGGSRMLQGLLKAEGLQTGRLHVMTLMKKMGIRAISRRPNTSKPAPGHKVYPYLLRKLAVTRPNQVWAMDISYTRRPHSSLDRQTPDQAHFNALTPMMVAA
jgi:putative transposase